MQILIMFNRIRIFFLLHKNHNILYIYNKKINFIIFIYYKLKN